jgi:hypothetical protein
MTKHSLSGSMVKSKMTVFPKQPPLIGRPIDLAHPGAGLSFVTIQALRNASNMIMIEVVDFADLECCTHCSFEMPENLR